MNRNRVFDVEFELEPSEADDDYGIKIVVTNHSRGKVPCRLGRDFFLLLDPNECVEIPISAQVLERLEP